MAVEIGGNGPDKPVGQPGSVGPIGPDGPRGGSLTPREPKGVPHLWQVREPGFQIGFQATQGGEIPGIRAQNGPTEPPGGSQSEGDSEQSRPQDIPTDEPTILGDMGALSDGPQRIVRPSQGDLSRRKDKTPSTNPEVPDATDNGHDTVSGDPPNPDDSLKDNTPPRRKFGVIDGEGIQSDEESARWGDLRDVTHSLFDYDPVPGTDTSSLVEHEEQVAGSIDESLGEEGGALIDLNRVLQDRQGLHLVDPDLDAFENLVRRTGELNAEMRVSIEPEVTQETLQTILDQMRNEDIPMHEAAKRLIRFGMITENLHEQEADVIREIHETGERVSFDTAPSLDNETRETQIELLDPSKPHAHMSNVYVELTSDMDMALRLFQIRHTCSESEAFNAMVRRGRDTIKAISDLDSSIGIRDEEGEIQYIYYDPINGTEFYL